MTPTEEQDKKKLIKRARRVLERLNKFRASVILNDGLLITPVYDEQFLEKRFTRLGRFEFYPVTEKDREEAKKLLNPEYKKEEEKSNLLEDLQDKA